MGNKITRRCVNVDECYTRPQGLYPQRDVDQKKLRRLILDSKLAPCFPGEDEPNADFEECPICFLCYPSLNRSKCCSKGICTECYLQVKSPRAARAAQCPFCKSHNYAVEFRGAKSIEEKSIEAADEQKFIEAKIRMRKQEILADEEREQRLKENRALEDGSDNTPGTRSDTLGAHSPAVEVPESCSTRAGVGETPQQESATSGLSGGLCDDLESSRAQEEIESEENLPSPAPHQPVLGPSLLSSLHMEFATPQHQSRAAPSGYTRHRAHELDFNLEDIMVMEAIWQSIQEQGTCHRNATSEAFQMASNQSTTDSDGDVDGASVSQVQSPPTGSERLYPRGVLTGSLASAIAALAERHAIKGEHFFESLRRASTAQAEVGTRVVSVQ